jgi:hypothetical protein
MTTTAARIVAVALALTVGLVAGCGSADNESNEEDAPANGPAKVEDPGPIHVHGLGINPADGSLFIATHTGLFRAAKGRRRATRVANRFQDTMGFTVVGPNDFLGSGHPDGREKLPPFLGLIRSADAGKSWRPISLLGKRDFHVLEAVGKRVYGYGSDFKTRKQGFLISRDGGRSWNERDVPEPLIALALDPSDPDRLLASGEGALYVSEDAGRGWVRIEGPAGLVAWSDQVTVIDSDGAVHTAEDPDGRIRPIGNVGGQPAALESDPKGDLYVALHDGTIKWSSDGGRSWSLRSSP